MTFFIEKSLATGPIRFGVGPRRELSAIESEAGLSTGPAGEFLRRRGGFFSADSRSAGAPILPTAPSITRVPFWESLKPDGTRRGWIFVALFALGLLFVLLGFAVVARKGPQGSPENLGFNDAPMLGGD